MPPAPGGEKDPHSMHPAPRAIAFFDVDETLIKVKSLIRFLAFHWARTGQDPSRFAAARAAHLRRQAAGTPRTELNRAFFRNFQGADAARLADAGRAWFDSETRRDGLFHQPVLDALHVHRRAGDLIVLVSGSFLPCLAPVAEAVHADAVLCTDVEERDGVLTGEIGIPVIGPRKAVLARRMMRARGVAPGACAAYGDHDTDAELLRAVGRPVVVGDNPLLGALARRHGWERLSLVAPPTPVVP
ncbi:HAD family hydrolase [Streptomyces venezuelae]|uniref:HAD family hydrolase n=1 Tax=Streptomyces venezuelae TaxID=54571 RepID=UPI0037981297